MSEQQLKPCPCGKTPDFLNIVDGNQGGKWAYTSGNCCGAWEVEFRTGYNPVGSPECMERAIDTWNTAPRAKDGVTHE